MVVAGCRGLVSLVVKQGQWDLHRSGTGSNSIVSFPSALRSDVEIKSMSRMLVAVGLKADGQCHCSRRSIFKWDFLIKKKKIPER